MIWHTIYQSLKECNFNIAPGFNDGSFNDLYHRFKMPAKGIYRSAEDTQIYFHGGGDAGTSQAILSHEPNYTEKKS